MSIIKFMSKFVDPIEILNKLNLKDDMTAADFGCGSGGWVIPLAKILEQGIIYAIDVQEEMLSVLETKLKAENIHNIRKVLLNIEDAQELKLPLLSCDLILMTNLLFQVEDKKQVFKQADKVLKRKGIILVVDWKPNNLLDPQKGKVSVDEVKKIAQEFNFELKKEFSAGDYHYTLVFEKK